MVILHVVGEDSVHLLHELEDKFVPIKRIHEQIGNKKPVWMSHKAFECL